MNSLDKPIERGRTAEVFSGDPGRVLKLYRAGWPEAAAQREFEIAQILEATCVPAPRARGILRIDGRVGVEFDEVEGDSMLDLLPRQPWRIASHARTLAALHFTIHSTTIAGLPSARDLLNKAIQRADDLGTEHRESALRLLASLPDGSSLCHGDFHPANVILSPTGPVVIDWPQSYSGNPLADVARSLVLFRFGPLAEPKFGKRALFRMFSNLFARSYLARYRKLAGVDDVQQLRRWVIVCTTARLAEGIEQEIGRAHV